MMLDVRANANRRNKHSTPGLSTMNISPFSKAEILRLLIFYIWFCNVISCSIRVFFFANFLFYRILCPKVNNAKPAHLPFGLLFSSGSDIHFLSCYCTFATARSWYRRWKWHSDTQARCRRSGIFRNIRCPPLTLSVAACISHVRRHPIRFTLSCDGLVFQGILHVARIPLREAFHANIGRDTNK